MKKENKAANYMSVEPFLSNNDMDDTHFDPFFMSSLRDSSGNDFLCKCGNQVTFFLAGKEAFLAQCSDCFVVKQ